MTPAPIAVSAYRRVDHFAATINALKKNRYAVESELYILSDAAMPGDEEKVKAVRDYAKGTMGFKRLEVIERETNSRTYNNRRGMQMLLEKYGKVIFLEEDIVTAPGFLAFINKGLSVYEDRKDIFSVCGYSPPIDPKFCKSEVYLSKRFVAWGFGIWAENYDSIVMDITERHYDQIMNSRRERKEFNRAGKDLETMLFRESRGEIDALDVKINYTLYKSGAFVVAPPESLTNNIGHDGSGTYCGNTKIFDVSLSFSTNEYEMRKNIPYDLGVEKKLIRFRKTVMAARNKPYYKQFITKLKNTWKRILQQITRNL